MIISFGSGYQQTVTTDNDGNWSVSLGDSISDFPAGLLDGAYTVSVSIKDAAGNMGTASGNGLIVDTTPIEFNVTDYNPGILGLLLPSVEGEAPSGTEIYIIGASLIGVGLLGIDLNVLEGYPSTTTDANGEWSYTLSLLDLDLLSGEDYYFLTIDQAGNYLVKDTDNQDFSSGNINDDPASISVEADQSIAQTGIPESSVTFSNEVSQNESIDLSRILVADNTVSSESEPLDLTINDVLSDAEQTDLLALDLDSEASSIAFSGDTSKSAESAIDVQNQSEEMIKKLIESGNNQIDS